MEKDTLREINHDFVKYYNFNRKRIMSNIMIISRDDETIPHFVEKYIIKAEQSSRV